MRLYIHALAVHWRGSADLQVGLWARHVRALNVNHSAVESSSDRTLVLQGHSSASSGTAAYGIELQSRNLHRSPHRIAFQRRPMRFDLSVCYGFKTGGPCANQIAKPRPT